MWSREWTCCSFPCERQWWPATRKRQRTWDMKGLKDITQPIQPWDLVTSWIRTEWNEGKWGMKANSYITLASSCAKSCVLCAHYLVPSSQQPDEVVVITSHIFTGSQRLPTCLGSGMAQEEKWFTECRGHKRMVWTDQWESLCKGASPVQLDVWSRVQRSGWKY